MGHDQVGRDDLPAAGVAHGRHHALAEHLAGLDHRPAPVGAATESQALPPLDDPPGRTSSTSTRSAASAPRGEALDVDLVDELGPDHVVVEGDVPVDPGGGAGASATPPSGARPRWTSATGNHSAGGPSPGRSALPVESATRRRRARPAPGGDGDRRRCPVFWASFARLPGVGDARTGCQATS